MFLLNYTRITIIWYIWIHRLQTKCCVGIGILAIQEYDCSIDWIKGELNVVADGLSRLTDEVPTTADNWAESTNIDEVVQEWEVPRRPTNDIEAASRGTVGNGSEPQLTEANRKKTNRKKKKEVKMNREVTDLMRSVEEVNEHRDTSTALSNV